MLKLTCEVVVALFGFAAVLTVFSFVELVTPPNAPGTTVVGLSQAPPSDNPLPRSPSR